MGWPHGSTRSSPRPIGTDTDGTGVVAGDVKTDKQDPKTPPLWWFSSPVHGGELGPNEVVDHPWGSTRSLRTRTVPCNSAPAWPGRIPQTPLFGVFWLHKPPGKPPFSEGFSAENPPFSTENPPFSAENPPFSVSPWGGKMKGWAHGETPKISQVSPGLSAMTCSQHVDRTLKVGSHGELLPSTNLIHSE